ncbi:MAG: hypothetical protein P8184_16440 [Calditrichia bacterium]
MKFSLLAIFISFRLAWGRVMNPLMIPANLPKIFPPARRAVYKKSLANYFFNN